MDFVSDFAEYRFLAPLGYFGARCGGAYRHFEKMGKADNVEKAGH